MARMKYASESFIKSKNANPMTPVISMMKPRIMTFFLPQRSNRIPIEEANTKAAYSGAPTMNDSFSSEIYS